MNAIFNAEIASFCFAVLAFVGRCKLITLQEKNLERLNRKRLDELKQNSFVRVFEYKMCFKTLYFILYEV